MVPIPLPIPGAMDPAALQQTVNAQTKAGEAQGRGSRGDSELNDLGAGTDPDFVNTIEHFEGMTHEAMYQAVHGPGGMDAAGLRTLQRTWFDSYSELVNLSTFNLMGMNRIFGDGGWQGASGEAAQAASQRFSQAANQIGRVFDSVANRMDALAWSAEAVRTAVQPPPTSVVVAPDPDSPVESILPGLINPEFDEQVRTAREQARQAAIRALNSAYTPTFPPAGTGVPAYTTVPQIAGTDAPNISPSADTGANGPSNVGGDPPDADPESPTQSLTGAAPSADPNVPATNPAGLGLPTGLVPDTNNASTNPASTTPAGLSPNTTTSPGIPGTSPGSPGVGPYNSSPGSPSGPGPGGLGAPSSLPGGPGSSRPGTPGASPVGAGTPSAGARPGVGTPARQMGAPIAPGAGARRQDDEAEHSAPDYLRRVQPDWTEGLESPSGTIGADLVPDHDVAFNMNESRHEDAVPNPAPGSGVNSASTDPAPPVDDPQLAPPVTFTGVGPLDSNPGGSAGRSTR
ncbi:hypothetical protein GCM10009764_76750 [Nocardia ninae]|uniref:PPE family domain-containing protein n=1 Tax=Nocardia ninae NBRC 108245 TaxID=1210091 RepID=A0A511MGU5_9NOCA|nr:hypothetical protein NN4_44320 [Nocardia ninae NBRC 108245]